MRSGQAAALRTAILVSCGVLVVVMYAAAFTTEYAIAYFRWLFQGRPDLIKRRRTIGAENPATVYSVVRRYANEPVLMVRPFHGGKSHLAYVANCCPAGLTDTATVSNRFLDYLIGKTGWVDE